MGVEKSWVECYFGANPEALEEERRVQPMSILIQELVGSGSVFDGIDEDDALFEEEDLS